MNCAMNSLSDPHYEWQETAPNRTAGLWLAGLIVAALIALAGCLSGCAGKDGINHPNADDWKAIKDAF